MSRKKRRHYSGPPKGAVVLYQESSESKWVNQWFPPKESAAYFLMDSDADFKRRHPVGYVFAVLLGISALLLPAIVFCVYITWHYQDTTYHIMLGCVGGFIVGIGLFNFVAIILHQYLGHLVSILCFLIGGAMMAVSVSLIG